MKARLSERTISQARAETRTRVIWDTETRGLGLRISPPVEGKPAARALVFKFSMHGRQGWITLGPAEIGVKQARALVIEARAKIARGIDPAEERKAEAAAREVAGKAPAAPTVAGVADRWLREHVSAKRKPSTAASYKRLIDTHVRPALGARPVAEVERREVLALHHSLRETPFEANRTVAVVSALFTAAERWGLRPDGTNPCRHVERYRERRRERYLSTAELAKLADTLATMEREWHAQQGDEALRRARRGHRSYRPTAALPPAPVSPTIAAAVRLLMLTGMRRGEVLGLRWRNVDVERACLRLDDSKTGRKTVPLGAPALKVLASLSPGEANDWVFPTVDGSGSVSLSRPWTRVIERAGLHAKDGRDGLRIHDLRHSFASVAAGGGESLLVIGRVLGHATPSTTARYSHLSDDPVRAAVERTSARIDAAMRGGPGADVVPLVSRDRG